MLPDTQATFDTRGISLPKVGIRKVYLPLTVTVNDKPQNVAARVSAYTDLNAQVKGINMSRIVEVLQPVFEEGLVFEGKNSEMFIQKILRNLVEKLESNDSYVQIGFMLFLPKEAPKSGKVGFAHYDVGLEGIYLNGEYKYYMKVRVQYISCCSCSKALSQHLESECDTKGAPHNQRSFADVKVELDPTNPLNIVDLINAIEDATYTIPYPLIKRPDEQEVAKRSWEHTQFCEDSVREIGLKLMEFANILDWVAVCNHEESIHQHNAVAILFKGKPGGLR